MTDISSPLAALIVFHPARAKIWVRAQQRGAPRLDIGKIVQAVRVVAAQAARLVIDQMLKLRDFLGKRLDLVDLLLVLHHGEANAGMVEHIGKLLGDRIGIDRHGHGAERLRRRERPIEPWTVRADDGDALAALQTEALEPNRQLAHLVALLSPGPALPDAVVLVTHGWTSTNALGVGEQIFGERVQRHAGGRAVALMLSLLPFRVDRGI